MNPMDLRIGIGSDIHCLAEKIPLVLGGFVFDHPCGLLGHSDADVLSHAICDALLGAAALGDIGSLFPDTDPAFKGISSLKLLEKIALKLKEENFILINIDATILAEAPKISPYKEIIAENIADSLGVEACRINIKASTNEGLDAVGRREGISALAVALLYKNKDKDLSFSSRA